MTVSIAIPVLNEERQLAASIATLHSYLQRECRFEHEIVIAENGSTDRTLDIALALAQKYSNVRVVHLDQKGRGRVLKQVWSESAADIVSYMDVDLSTGLGAFPPLIEAVASQRFDLAIGSRLHKDAHTERGWRREYISRGYNRLVKALFGTRFSDAQCGFKAITRKALLELLPLVEDNGWFMDTELLILAEKCGYRIFDLPVTWVDDPDSRVRVFSTAWADLKGLLRLRRNLQRGLYADLRLKNSQQTTNLAATSYES